MAKKSLEISAKVVVDTADLTRTIQQAKRELAEINGGVSSAIRREEISRKLRSAGYGGLAGTGAGGHPLDVRRNIDQSIQKELRSQEELYKTQIKQEKALEKAAKLGKENLEFSKSYQNTLKDQVAGQEKLNVLLEQQNRLKKAGVGQSTGLAVQSGGGGGGWTYGGGNGLVVPGGPGGGGGGGPQVGSRGERGGMLGNLLGTSIINAGLTAALAALKGMVRRPVEIQQAQGSAVQGTTGLSLSQMQSGDFTFETMFPESRETAKKNAGKVRTRQTIMDMFNPLTWGDQERAAAKREAQYAEDLQTGYESGKQLSPEKKDAVERLKRTMGRDISMQRQLGLGDKAYMGEGGYLRNILGGGFSEESGIAASQGIVGAGGSTEMARNPLMALQMQRGLNMTNASPMLGMLSGAMGSAQNSKETLIDIFSTAQQIGLDKSKYAEENRKFMQNVVEIVSQGGGISSRQGAAQIEQTMGAFATGATTVKGIENAKAAYEATQRSETSTSGFSGAINAAVLMKKFPRLAAAAGGDAASFQRMMELTQAERDPTSDLMMSKTLAYNRANPNNYLSPKGFADELEKAHVAQGAAKYIGVQKELGSLSQDMIRFSKENGSMKGYTMGGTAVKDFDVLEARAHLIPEFQNLSAPQLKQAILGQAARSAKYLPGGNTPSIIDYEKEANKSMESKDTGRAIDSLLSTSATNATTSLKTLATTIDDLAVAASKAAGKVPVKEEASSWLSPKKDAGFMWQQQSSDPSGKYYVQPSAGTNPAPENK